MDLRYYICLFVYMCVLIQLFMLTKFLSKIWKDFCTFALSIFILHLYPNIHAPNNLQSDSRWGWQLSGKKRHIRECSSVCSSKLFEAGGWRIWMHFNTFALFMFSKVDNIKKEKGHNCKKGEFLFCFNFFSWQFLDYTNHANPSFSFFPSLFQQTRKKLREKLQKKSQGRRNQRAEHQTKLWLPVQMIQTLTAVWMWRSGRNCSNRWQVSHWMHYSWASVSRMRWWKQS